MSQHLTSPMWMPCWRLSAPSVRRLSASCCGAARMCDACETRWDAAYRINAIGPRNLAIAAAEVDAKLIHVSTDYAVRRKRDETVYGIR